MRARYQRAGTSLVPIGPLSRRVGWSGQCGQGWGWSPRPREELGVGVLSGEVSAAVVDGNDPRTQGT